MIRFTPPWFIGLIGVVLASAAFGQMINADIRANGPSQQLNRKQRAIKQIKAEGNCLRAESSNNWHTFINCGVNIEVSIGGLVSFAPRYREGDRFVDPVIAVLPVNQQWRIDSETEIGDERTQAYQPLESIVQTFRREAWARVPLANAMDIITVGLASQEIPVGMTHEAGLYYEEDRANKRALALYQQVYNSIRRPLSKNMYTLSLGKYSSEQCPDQKSGYLTGYQRPVIVVSILDRSPNVDEAFIRNALAERLSQFAGYVVAQSCYTQFELAPGQTARPGFFNQGSWF